MRREKKRLHVCAPSLRENVVHLAALVVQPAEPLAVLREWAARVTNPRPGCVDVDRHPGNERGAIESRLRRLGENCATPESDNRRRPCQGLGHELLLDSAELGLAALEELADRAEALLDLLVGVDERAVGELRELTAERRLPRPHEPDEGEVLVYRADHGMRSR